MIEIRKIEDLKSYLGQKRGARSLGFVPTMGDLHEGHLSLLRRSKTENDLTLLSIFVNPIQFDQKEDYERYHKQEKDDIEQAKKIGVDCVFLPSVKEFYPSSFQTYVEVENLTQYLCGARRPGHFRGVATVVLKFFNLIQPTRAYFGMKDYQQYRVIERMVQDFQLPIQIVPCPILREIDGLAMSSRNRRLSMEERARARTIFSALESAAKQIHSNQSLLIRDLKNQFSSKMSLKKEDKIEYFETVDPVTLLPMNKIQSPILLAAAVWIGSTRLIDNILVE